MYDTLGQGVTAIGRCHCVVGDAISFLAERWSGAGRNNIFELRNNVLAEGIPRLAIGEFLRVPMLGVFGVHSACLVDLDESV